MSLIVETTDPVEHNSPRIIADSLLPLPDSLNSFIDLSGTATPVRKPSVSQPTNEYFENPYDAMLHVCSNDSEQIAKAYDTHRRTRNSLSRHKLLTDDTPIKLDSLLLRSHVLQDGTVDFRNCLVFWARPPSEVRDLIASVQEKLKAAAPHIWLMPKPNLHLTVLEVTHSQTPTFVSDLVKTMSPSLPSIADYTNTHRARLEKPMLSFDGSACAVSFIPACSPSDTYTYQHLRRDLYDRSKEAGVTIESRYTVPSAHVTVGRFITLEDHKGKEKMEKWVGVLDEINKWLEGYDGPGGEWVVGEEKGLDIRVGRLWYGGGESFVVGKGFERPS